MPISIMTGIFADRPCNWLYTSTEKPVIAYWLGQIRDLRCLVLTDGDIDTGQKYSCYPPGDNRGVAELCAKKLADEGIPVEVVSLPRRPFRGILRR